MTARRPRWFDPALTAVLTVVVLGPLLLTGGFVLIGDMVFVPDQPWKHAWTGGDGGVPRAVPGDAWVAVLDDLLTGEVLQKLVLAAIFLAAGTGMSSLLRQLPTAGRAAGVVLYLWNPYVYERLAIGHWALLCGYAALPWAVSAALRVRAAAAGSHDERPRRAVGAWAVLAAAFAAAGWTSPTGGLLVVLVAVACVVGSAPTLARTALLGGWINLPWIVPAVLNGTDQLGADAFGVTAFASRADTPWGVPGSLLTLGGIWKESIVPDDRGDVLLSAVALLVIALSVAGLVLLRRRPVIPLGVAASLTVAALAVAGLSAVPALRPFVEWVVVEVPGGGLVRDSQKWLMPWVLVASTGLASFVAWVQARTTRFGAQARLWWAAVAALPLLALPSMAFGLAGFLSTSHYPDDWFEVREVMEEVGAADDRVVVLPFSTYRRFDWNVRTVLDPAPRFLPGQMVTDDALVVQGGTVGGESELARAVRLSRGPEALSEVLRDADVRWALVHRSTDEVLLPAAAEPLFLGDQLELYDLRPADADRVEDGTGPGTRAIAYLVLDLAVLLLTAGVVVVSTSRAISSRPRATRAYTRGN